MKKIHEHIKWEPFQRMLLDVYPAGKEAVGNNALVFIQSSLLSIGVTSRVHFVPLKIN